LELDVVANGSFFYWLNVGSLDWNLMAWSFEVRSRMGFVLSDFVVGFLMMTLLALESIFLRSGRSNLIFRFFLFWGKSDRLSLFFGGHVSIGDVELNDFDTLWWDDWQFCTIGWFHRFLNSSFFFLTNIRIFFWFRSACREFILIFKLHFWWDWGHLLIDHAWTCRNEFSFAYLMSLFLSLFLPWFLPWLFGTWNGELNIFDNIYWAARNFLHPGVCWSRLICKLHEFGRVVCILVSLW
jgi:hypothetical protein